MVKQILFIAFAFLIGTSSLSAQTRKSHKSHFKFIDDIEISFFTKKEAGPSNSPFRIDPVSIPEKTLPSFVEKGIEMASSLQIKYSLLLDTEIEQIKNLDLFGLVDDWFGTPYRMGGTTKKGIDCSAFVQIMYAGLFGLAIPRTAREQFGATRQISRTELEEGDLVFFNTRGGVSHVGIYLQNNKFAHAASSAGVMISDLYDEYWAKRFLGVGRFDKVQLASLYSQP